MTAIPRYYCHRLAGSCVTHDGDVWHEPTRSALAGPTEGEHTS